MEYKAESITVLKNLKDIRENFDTSIFRNLERGEHQIIGKKIGAKSETISKICDEVRILKFFPNLDKSKAVPLARLKLDKELILFSEKYDIYGLQVRQIKKLVKEWRLDIERYPKNFLTDLQHDLIIGTVMGDANISQRNRNCVFRVGHSPKQKRYVEWKFGILKDFNSKGIKLTQRTIKNRLINTYEFRLNAHYLFNFYRNLFYDSEGNKIITENVLKYLTPRSLAIWLCDDGSYSKKQKYIVICTNSYSLKEHKIIKKYFEDKWNISPTIGLRDKKYYYLRFKKEDTKKLINIVKPFVPKFIRYKIGEENE